MKKNIEALAEIGEEEIRDIVELALINMRGRLSQKDYQSSIKGDQNLIFKEVKEYGQYIKGLIDQYGLDFSKENQDFKEILEEYRVRDLYKKVMEA